MRTKTLSTALAAFVCIGLALPVSAADSAKTPENVLQALANAMTAWFVEIAAELEAVAGAVPEDSATTVPPTSNDGDRTELGPIIFPGG